MQVSTIVVMLFNSFKSKFIVDPSVECLVGYPLYIILGIYCFYR